ncbi:hypothetical protein NDU88_003044 [Pleurodeles waltl]|uniref:Uncharacterized protein n=1 Tax=Pleurodeles waltl TaxID=8319 RepID=A0AAV7KTS0_PLEWA|nr:hypothetical protein NDU88_003044 [Pleurodeles waltl]
MEIGDRSCQRPHWGTSDLGENTVSPPPVARRYSTREGAGVSDSKAERLKEPGSDKQRATQRPVSCTYEGWWVAATQKAVPDTPWEQARLRLAMGAGHMEGPQRELREHTTREHKLQEVESYCSSQTKKGAGSGAGISSGPSCTAE